MPKLITIVGLDVLRRRVDGLQRDIEVALPDALYAGGLVIQNAWKRNIVAMHAVKTGTYLRSVHTEVTSRRPAEVTVGTDITDPPYPEFVEYGTSRMAARPAARQAVDNNQTEVENEVADALKGIMGRYGG